MKNEKPNYLDNILGELKEAKDQYSKENEIYELIDEILEITNEDMINMLYRTFPKKGPKTFSIDKEILNCIDHFVASLHKDGIKTSRSDFTNKALDLVRNHYAGRELEVNEYTKNNKPINEKYFKTYIDIIRGDASEETIKAYNIEKSKGKNNVTLQLTNENIDFITTLSEQSSGKFRRSHIMNAILNALLRKKSDILEQ